MIVTTRSAIASSNWITAKSSLTTQSGTFNSWRPSLSELEKEMSTSSSRAFSVQDQNRLVNNGIGPAYILELKNAGYRDLTVAQLVALRSNGVHADYIAALKSVGFAGLPPEQLI